MATYVTLLKFTTEGRRGIADTSGLDGAKGAAEAMGVQWKGWYMTFGRYDAVVVVEAPDDEAVARLALATATSGAIVSETMRAFTEDEFRGLVAALPQAGGGDGQA